MTAGAGHCDRCGQSAEHRFPDPRNAARICSRCYENLRLHQQGVMLSSFGVAAIVLGAGVLVALAVLLLTA